AGPLAVAGVQILFAVTRGASIVDLQNRIPAVGEPLRLGVVAPDVARPRAPVNIEDKRHLLALAARWVRQISMDGKTILGGERNRLHLGELVLLERGLIGEERRGLLGRAIPRIPPHWAVIDVKRDDPRLVGQIAAADANVAIAHLA